MSGKNSRPAFWRPDESAKKCELCQKDFGVFRRKHHCRSCGGVFCDSCTKGREEVVDDNGTVLSAARVCDTTECAIRRSSAATKQTDTTAGAGVVKQVVDWKAGGGDGNGVEETDLLESLEPRGECLICNPELRDPMTIALSFMRNPSPFRVSCKFTAECWEQAIYLEGILPCPTVTLEGARFPVLRTELFYKGTTTTGGRPTWQSQRDEGCWEQQERELEARATQLIVTRLTRLHKIEKAFLSAWSNMTEATIENIPFLNSIEDGLLYGCLSLEVLKFIHLPQLECIGHCFLNECKQLKQVTIRDLPRLTSVGDRWMYGCVSLEHVEISSFPQLTTIGGWFINRCTNLKSARLTDLPQLHSIGTECLFHSASLEVVEISSLPLLVELGYSFLAQCKNLKRVDIVDVPQCNPKYQGSWMKNSICEEVVVENSPGMLVLKTVAQ